MYSKSIKLNEVTVNRKGIVFDLSCPYETYNLHPQKNASFSNNVFWIFMVLKILFAAAMISSLIYAK